MNIRERAIKEMKDLRARETQNSIERTAELLSEVLETNIDTEDVEIRNGRPIVEMDGLTFSTTEAMDLSSLPLVFVGATGKWVEFWSLSNLGQILVDAERAEHEAVDDDRTVRLLLCPLSNEQPCYRTKCAWWVEGEGLIGRCAVSSLAHQGVIAEQILGQELVVEEGFDFAAAVQAANTAILDDAQVESGKVKPVMGEYSVGTLTNPKPDDQRFSFFEEAEEPCPYCSGQGWGIVGVDWDCDDAVNGPYDGECQWCPNCGGSGRAEDMTFW